MYELKIIESFDAAHCIEGYDGNCARIHGHTWRVEIVVKGEKLNNLGILIDFKDLKKIIKSTISAFDHHYLNDLPDFKRTGINPTAENISKMLYDKLKSIINNNCVHLSRVVVWESDTSCATYFEL